MDTACERVSDALRSREVGAFRDHRRDHGRETSEERRQGGGAGGYACSMASPSETKSGELMDRLGRLEEQMRRMQDDLDARLDAIAEGLEASRADDEAETLAAERIRNGAVERAQDGAEVPAELGIRTP